jgi:hypothetical protein
MSLDVGALIPDERRLELLAVGPMNPNQISLSAIKQLHLELDQFEKQAKIKAARPQYSSSRSHSPCISLRNADVG